MCLKHLISFSILALLLAACAGPTSTPPIVLTASAVRTPYPSAATPASHNPTVNPVITKITPVSTVSSYPGPIIPIAPTATKTPSDYDPQPGDDRLVRDPVSLDLASSKLVITATESTQVSIELHGDLPEKHHVLRVVVNPPDEQNIISVEVYSLVPPGILSGLVPEPFIASIPLGSFATGKYAVVVNGERLGEFGTAYAPQPGDEKLTRDEVSLNMADSSLLITDGQSKYVTAILQGTLPDPCHQLRILYTPADRQNKINLEVYSLVDPNTMCIMVIQPFQVLYPLGSFSPGHYSVYVNGQLLEEFDS